ncbi:MAG TPA: GNVR domain-containing protein [Candidatus Acidoferrales bacterium]|nr:GNVR domain-containing protein [Candidatus Acidoferrales bacterium]
MSKDVEIGSRHEEELDLAEPLLDEEDVRAARERAIARLTLLWNRRQFLARTAGVGLLVATLIAFLIPKRFTSTARLMPPDQGPGNGMAMMAALASKAGSLGSLGSELLGLKTTGDLFIGILQSRTVQDDLITKFDLRKVYSVREWESARKILASRTDVSQDRKSEIITISVFDRSPNRAQEMAAEYINSLDSVVTNLNTSSAHRERVFLEGRLSQVQTDLESAEKTFSQFASKNTAINIEEQGKAMITAGATLEGQLIAAQTELEGLRQIFTDNNVRVRETQARVDELKNQLRNIGGKAGPTSGGTEQNEGLLYPTIRQLPVLGVTYADLYRRMKVEEAVFETLTQQYEAAKVEEAKETPSVKVLDPPNVPEKKSFPPRLLIMFLGILMAFAAGVTWLLGSEAWDSTDPSDVRKVFATRVWSDVRASVPWAARNGHNGTGPKHHEGEAQVASGEASRAEENGGSPSLPKSQN